MFKFYCLSFCFLFFISCASSENEESYKEGLGGDSVMNFKDNSTPAPDSADTIPIMVPDNSAE